MSTPPTTTGVSRRRVLAGLGTAAIGATGLLALTTDRTRAAVTMGEFAVSGAEADVDAPPTRIDIHVSGEYQVTTANGAPEMTEIVLQARVGDEPLVDDIGLQTDFDSTGGPYDITADLYDHKDVSRGDFTPTDGGATTETPLTVRVVCVVVDGGEIQTEAYVEDSTTLVINKAGMVAALGGQGSVNVVIS